MVSPVEAVGVRHKASSTMCSAARELFVRRVGRGGGQGAYQGRFDVQFTAERTGQWMKDVLQIAMNESRKGHVLSACSCSPAPHEC